MARLQRGRNGEVPPLLGAGDGLERFALGKDGDVAQRDALLFPLPVGERQNKVFYVADGDARLVRHDDHVVAAVGNGGGGGFVPDGFGNLHVHLRRGQPLAHGLFLIHADGKLRRGALKAVRNGFHAGHLRQQSGHLPCAPLEAVQVLAVEVDRDAAAGKRGHIHAGAACADLAVQIRAQRFQLVGNRGAGLFLVAAQHHIHLQLVGAGAGGQAHHAAQPLGLHDAHGVHIGERGEALTDLVRHGGAVGKGCRFIQRDVKTDLRAVHLGHVGKAAGNGGVAREQEQEQREQEDRRLVAQHNGQQPRIQPGQTVEQRWFFLLLHAAEYAAGQGGDQRQRHDQAGQQRIADGQRHVRKELPRHALNKDDGQEHANRGER